MKNRVKTVLQEYYETLNLPMSFDSLSEASKDILRADKDFNKFLDDLLKKEKSIDYSFKLGESESNFAKRKRIARHITKSLVNRIFNN